MAIEEVSFRNLGRCRPTSDFEHRNSALRFRIRRRMPFIVVSQELVSLIYMCKKSNTSDS